MNSMNAAAIARQPQTPPASLGVTHVVFTDSLPSDEGARASAGGKVIFVNSSWSGRARRQAVHAELRILKMARSA